MADFSMRDLARQGFLITSDFIEFVTNLPIVPPIKVEEVQPSAPCWPSCTECSFPSYPWKGMVRRLIIFAPLRSF